jgi:hypothetical protein
MKKMLLSFNDLTFSEIDEHRSNSDGHTVSIFEARWDVRLELFRQFKSDLFSLLESLNFDIKKLK